MKTDGYSFASKPCDVAMSIASQSILSPTRRPFSCSSSRMVEIRPLLNTQSCTSAVPCDLLFLWQFSSAQQTWLWMHSEDHSLTWKHDHCWIFPQKNEMSVSFENFPKRVTRPVWFSFSSFIFMTWSLGPPRPESILKLRRSLQRGSETLNKHVWRDLKNGISTWIIYLGWDGSSKIQENLREEVEFGDLFLFFFFFSVIRLKSWRNKMWRVYSLLGRLVN